MTRKIREIPLGERGARYLVTLTDVPSAGADIRGRQVAFLQELVNDGLYTGLLGCGPDLFQTLRMRHDGTAWVVELEAEHYL